VAGGWRKLFNEELHNLYPSPNHYWDNQIKEVEMGVACSLLGREEDCI
jgi:hypothetical protein